MAKLYYDNQADLGRLAGRTVAIIGFGSQGHAHALNLKESGVDVVVGLYPGSKSWAKAEAAGLTVMSVADASKAAQIIMNLTPDTVQAKVYREDIAPNIAPGKTLMFAHGFNIRYGQIVPPAGIDAIALSTSARSASSNRVRSTAACTAPAAGSTRTVIARGTSSRMTGSWSRSSELSSTTSDRSI